MLEAYFKDMQLFLGDVGFLLVFTIPWFLVTVAALVAFILWLWFEVFNIPFIFRKRRHS